MSMAMVTVGGGCPAYLTGAGNIGVVVIQEWWGLNDQIKRFADRIASAGPFSVIAPDLYRGKVGHSEDEASHLMDHLDWAGAVRDIEACVEHFGEKRVAVMGFCMGGALALSSAAALGSRLSASVCFYGVPKDLSLAPIAAPLQLHFGAKDCSTGFSDPASAQKLHADLEQAGKVHEFWMYEGVGHAFMNEKGKGYSREAAETALNRATDFILKHCGRAHK